MGLQEKGRMEGMRGRGGREGGNRKEGNFFSTLTPHMRECSFITAHGVSPTGVMFYLTPSTLTPTLSPTHVHPSPHGIRLFNISRTYTSREKMQAREGESKRERKRQREAVEKEKEMKGNEREQKRDRGREIEKEG